MHVCICVYTHTPTHRYTHLGRMAGLAHLGLTNSGSRSQVVPIPEKPELQRPVRGGRQRADSGDFLEGETRGPQVSRVMGGGMPCWGLER